MGTDRDEGDRRDRRPGAQEHRARQPPSRAPGTRRSTSSTRRSAAQAHARVDALLGSFPVYPEIDLPFLLESFEHGAGINEIRVKCLWPSPIQTASLGEELVSGACVPCDGNRPRRDFVASGARTCNGSSPALFWPRRPWSASPCRPAPTSSRREAGWPSPPGGFWIRCPGRRRRRPPIAFDAPERLNWHFIPRDRKGLPIKEMTSAAARPGVRPDPHGAGRSRLSQGHDDHEPGADPQGDRAGQGAASAIPSSTS